MSNTHLKEIQSLLREKETVEAKLSFRKFVPTSQKVYGVRLPQINEMVQKYKFCGFSLVVQLWKSGAFEERLLSAKILGKIAKKEPHYTLQLIE